METAKYEAAKRSLDDQLAVLKANQAEGGASALQVLDQTKAIRDQETALEKQHLQAMSTIWADYPKEHRKYQLQLAEVDAQRRSQALKDELSYQQSVVGSYRQSMQSIASTISSSLSAMLERTGKLSDLLKNVAKNVEQQFISSSLKMVTDWIVDRTKEVAITVATEASKTAAVASGNAAREASTIGSLAAQAAATVASFGRTIAADAAAAFAGVTAFLSPIMGPAAIGPAAGIEATVMAAAAAIPKFDRGAWTLPSDQIAMVHAGEMITPAFEANLFRQAVTNLAGGGGSGGTTVNHHYGDLNVHAIDAASVQKWARSNGKSLMRGLAEAGHYGAALGAK